MRRDPGARHAVPVDETALPPKHSIPVLASTAQAFVEATALPPYLFELPVDEGRHSVDVAQDGEFPEPATLSESFRVPFGDRDSIDVTLFRPPGVIGVLPVVIYVHGAGWVFGDLHTHDRLVRELTVASQAAVLFVSYSLSPEAKYPRAIEEIYAVLDWVRTHGVQHNLDPERLAVAGDSVGGNMSAAVTLMAKSRGGPKLAGQLLFYPVTDAAFDTDSYHQFATGYWLRRDGMQWFWNQYVDAPEQRSEITASPLRATVDDLTGLPAALVITAEADVLRDEGEAYAAKLRKAGVPVTSVRYAGAIHDFVMLHALKDTCAALAATAQGGQFLRSILHPKGQL
jgi:acetyl esterase